MKRTHQSRSTNVTASCAIAAALTASSASAVTANAFANGSFETLGTTTPAESWLPAAAGYSIASGAGDARTGNNAALLASPELNAARFLQNSVGDGGQPTLTVGETASFSFWAKGFAGTTGNVSYALRLLDSGGGIVQDSGFTQFQGLINPTTYTEITLPDFVIPAGASSAFLDIGQAIGPINGSDLLGGSIFIDDIVLSTVPEPSAVILLGSGLGLLTLRRRRA